jgi:hypothetical protein
LSYTRWPVIAASRVVFTAVRIAARDAN